MQRRQVQISVFSVYLLARIMCIVWCTTPELPTDASCMENLEENLEEKDNNIRSLQHVGRQQADPHGGNELGVLCDR